MLEAIELLKNEARFGKGISKTTAIAQLAKIAEVERQDLNLTEYEVVTIPFNEIIQKYGAKFSNMESA